jgi:hypothetical protein
MIIGGYTLKKAINEEAPIRTMMLRRKVQWNPDLNLAEDCLVQDEARVTEYCRSLLYAVLDDLILINGQDLKSEQWVLEPLADMVIALSIMDTAVKRFLQLTPGTKHTSETLEVLKVSAAERSEMVISKANYIWNYILDNNSAKEKLSIANQYWKKLNYSPNIIKGKMKIMEKVNHYKKYYLDREEK